MGLPGRAVNTPFVKSMGEGKDMSSKECPYSCLKKCDHHYCISDRLMMARDGNVQEGLVFSGENAYKLDKILPVAEIFRQFKEQAESLYKEGKGFTPLSS